MGSKISWFGGHMARTVRELKDRLRLVDLVLEVRDARIPFSSANPELDRLVQHKHRLVVLNKADLAEPNKQQAVLHALQQQKLGGVFTSTHKAGTIKQLLQQARGVLQDKRPNADALVIMTVGVPNTGKSALINSLRHVAKAKKEGGRGKAATGATPGLTRHISGFQVGERPTTFIMDTPGVMLPHVTSHKVGMQLALTGAIKDSIVSEEALVEHLLWELAQQPQLTYQRHKPGQEASKPQKASSVVPAIISAVEAMQQANQLPAHSSNQESDASQSGPQEALYEAAVVHGPAASSAATNACSDSTKQCIMEADAGQGSDAAASGNRAEGASVRQSQAKFGLSQLQHYLKVNVSDTDRLNAAYRKVIDAYRTGRLGRYTLDDVNG